MEKENSRQGKEEIEENGGKGKGGKHCIQRDSSLSYNGKGNLTPVVRCVILSTKLGLYLIDPKFTSNILPLVSLAIN